MTISAAAILRSRPGTEVGRLARFAVVGLLGLAVNNGRLWLLTEHGGLYYLVSSAIATEAAIIHNFILNHWWTFGGAHRATSVDETFLRYNAVAVGSLVLTVTKPLPVSLDSR